MSKNTKAENITKATITDKLDTIALSVAEQAEKTKVTQTEKLLSLIGGEKKFNAATDTEKRKHLDLCISVINDRIDALKAENKSLPKEDRKPLSGSLLWQGLRSLLGLASAMRSRLRTNTEKEAAKTKAEKARAENEEKISEAHFAAGKVGTMDNVNVKTATSLEEGVILLIEMAYQCKVSLASLQDMIARRF